MDYNTQREKLKLPEYGRNVQIMINHAKTIEDREERNKAAETIINVMAQGQWEERMIKSCRSPFISIDQVTF